MSNELNKKTASQIEVLQEEAEEFWTNKQYDKVIEKNVKAWALLPEPKGNYDDSFHIARTLSMAYLLLKKLNEAKAWSNKLYDCDTSRYDMGERDFLRGKIEYELGNDDEARKFFKNADAKSKKRCWKGEENLKYFLFFKKK